MTYYFDNEDGCISLYRFDRTYHNRLAFDKGSSVGQILAIIVNELDRLPRNESISVTLTRPLSKIQEIDDGKNPWSKEDKEMVASLIRHFVSQFDELCHDRYGHQEIVSDLKESCREKIHWLKKLQKQMEE